MAATPSTLGAPAPACYTSPMPLVRITRRAGFPAAENKRLLDAVHAGLVEADVKPGFKLDV